MAGEEASGPSAWKVHRIFPSAASTAWNSPDSLPKKINPFSATGVPKTAPSAGRLHFSAPAAASKAANLVHQNGI